MRIGRTDEADRLLAETLETVHQTGHRLQEAERYRLNGELLLKIPRNEPDAEPYFLRAIEIARGRSAKCATVKPRTDAGEARPAR